MTARELFTVGQSVKPSAEALERRLWITYRGVKPEDKRGRVVGFSSADLHTVRVQWDGHKTSQKLHVTFVDLCEEASS